VTIKGGLILASSSKYRQNLLRRLGIPFRCVSPDVDESAAETEAAEALALRLAHAKAVVISDTDPSALVLASDQTADLNGRVLGKPGDRVRATEQLQSCSGQSVRFCTAVVLRRGVEVLDAAIVSTDVRFRELSNAEIECYLSVDEPYDCAGSFRWEGIGIALFEGLRSDDPSALEGLPLITVTSMLRGAGLNPLEPLKPA
jgi:septum formation protein